MIIPYQWNWKITKQRKEKRGSGNQIPFDERKQTTEDKKTHIQQNTAHIQFKDIKAK